MTAFEFQTQIIHHSDFIESFARKYAKSDEDAKDLAQETTLRALMNYTKFKTNTNLKGWLRIIMRNQFINGYRRKASKVVTYDSDSYLVKQGETDFYSPDSIINTALMNRLIDKLPTDLRLPFVKHFEGFKYHEIAEEMDIPIGTIKSRIFQARKALSAQINYEKG